MFFPLVNTCVVEIENSSTDRSGQDIKSWTSIGTFHCLYTPIAGSHITSPRDEFQEQGTLYVEPSVAIKPGYRVITITDSVGNVIENGPFLVHSVRNFMNFNGSVHHKTVKLVGVAKQ